MIYTVTLSPARDRGISVKGFAPGKLNRASSVRDDPGGKGINVSKVIRELGGKSTALCVLGGETGRYIERALTEMGIDTACVYTPFETRTNIKIFDTLSGETTDVNESAHVDAGAAQDLFNRLLSRVQGGDVCVFAGRIDTNAADLASWIRELNAKGAKVFLDTEGEALKVGTAASPFLIKPNEYELEVISGGTEKDNASLARTALQISHSHGINTVFISIGERGAIAARNGQAYELSAPVINAVCTTGAGDAVTAALAYAEQEQMAFQDACALSMACGAASVMMPGTQCPSKKLISSLIGDVIIRRLL